MKNITVYTTTTCAYCAMVKKYLTAKGHAFTSVNLDDDPELRQKLVYQTGAMTVPITRINEKFIIGWKPMELAAAL
jgi:glutaredoxin 3